MVSRFFWRRGFALVIDFALVGFIAMLFISVANNISPIPLLAPEFIRSNSCELKSNLISKERMEHLLPLEDGQQHVILLCEQTNFFISRFNTTSLMKVWKKDGTNFNVNVSYYSDELGNQKNYIPIGPLVILVQPLIFALLLFMFGRTPGKRILNLRVFNHELQKPDLKAALKREYLKAIVLVIGAGFSIYSIFMLFNFDIEEAALLLKSIEDNLETPLLNFGLLIGLLFGVAVFWFQFGSFILWKGSTYWDRFAKLTVGSDEYLAEKQREQDVAEVSQL